jgi:hypothetical protein
MQANAGLDIGHALNEDRLDLACHGVPSLAAACKVPANIMFNGRRTTSISVIAAHRQRSDAQRRRVTAQMNRRWHNAPVGLIMTIA